MDMVEMIVRLIAGQYVGEIETDLAESNTSERNEYRSMSRDEFLANIAGAVNHEYPAGKLHLGEERFRNIVGDVVDGFSCKSW